MAHPLDYHPAEIWDKIAEYLTEPKDFLNFTESHPFLLWMFDKKRTHVLLTLVLPIIGDMEGGGGRDDAGNKLMRFSNNAMAQYRFVCKDWNRKLCDYFQRHLYESKDFICDNPTACQFEPHPDDDEYHSRKRPALIWDPMEDQLLDIEFNQNDSIYRRWLHTAQQTHPPNSLSNPILSREVTFFIAKQIPDHPAVLQDFLATIKDFFTAYGHHVWHCSLIFERFIVPLENIYPLLREWLTLTPNLKTLFVHGAHEGEVERIPANRIKLLQDQIQANPLPNLNDLRELEMASLPHPIQTAFLKKYGHASVLYLKSLNSYKSYRGFQQVQLTALKKLTVQITSSSDFLALKRCLTLSWLQNLETLKIDCYTFYSDNDIEENPDPPPRLKDVVNLLNKLFSKANNLVNLYLALAPPLGTAIIDSEHCRLNLGSVQQLKLWINAKCRLDFILPMKNLKRLAVKNTLAGGHNGFPSNNGTRVPEVVQWNGWLGKKLLESNLWTHFPSLKFARVECTRGWSYVRPNKGQPVMFHPNGAEEAKASTGNNDSEEISEEDVANDMISEADDEENSEE